MGGATLPKKVVAFDANGQAYPHLVKNGDDLRQDAVVQQVFSQVNSLLSSAPETRERRLRMQTYKVVPLTPHVGVVEWVTDTVPLSTWLFQPQSPEQGAAHARYNRTDWTHSECAAKMRNAGTVQGGSKARVMTMAACCCFCAHERLLMAPWHRIAVGGVACAGGSSPSRASALSLSAGAHA